LDKQVKLIIITSGQILNAGKKILQSVFTW